MIVLIVSYKYGCKEKNTQPEREKISVLQLLSFYSMALRTACNIGATERSSLVACFIHTFGVSLPCLKIMF